VASNDSPTDSEDPNNLDLVKELVKLRREIRRRDDLHKEELQRVKAEFSAALTEVRQELQTLIERPATPLSHPESCIQNHEEILREIQSLRISVSPSVSIGSPSYADIARTPPTSQPSNIQTLSSSNTTPTALIDTLYCTIDTSQMAVNENKRPSVGPIRRAVEAEIDNGEAHELAMPRCHGGTRRTPTGSELRGDRTWVGPSGDCGRDRYPVTYSETPGATSA
jgi:hypothetical protein